MKTVRIWLLVLLAALLPVRGALAAAVLCPPAKVQGQRTAVDTASVAQGDHHSIDVADHEHADHQQAEHEAGPPGTGEHHSDGFGKCNLCCEFCSMTPLLSTPPSVPVPNNPSSVSFPDLFAPAPSFVSDGQERPPRTI